MSIDLCEADDVYGYVPGFDPEDEANAATVAKLASLITAESESVMRESGREIKAFASEQTQRAFKITDRVARSRSFSVGDLTIGEGFTVSLLDANDDNPVEVDQANVRPIYFGRLQPVEAWEPITDIELKPAAGSLIAGRLVVVDGVWGWPSVPQFIVEATAKRVVLRYISDVAASGTAFSDAVDNANLAGLFASARDAVASIGRKVMIR